MRHCFSLKKVILTFDPVFSWSQDIEWAKDGVTGELFIVQSRPETVKSSQFRRSGAVVEVCVLAPGQVKTPLVTGRSVGARIGTGAVRVIMEAKDMNTLKDGEILVTDITDPDWEPVMRRASAIVTNRGGRTCHAAIVAREIGSAFTLKACSFVALGSRASAVPAIVGCSVATQLLTTGTPVTVVCSEGDTGSVVRKQLAFRIHFFFLSLPRCSTPASSSLPARRWTRPSWSGRSAPS